MSYHGLPVSDYALKAAYWNPLTTNVAKRADPWLGKLMSSAARLALTNSYLSNLPLHAMGVYMLGDGVHAILDGSKRLKTQIPHGALAYCMSPSKAWGTYGSSTPV